ncbi:HIR complex subunit, partial [Coemansia sp. RSA 1358]
MRITKPEWLHHDADKKKLTAIFSVDFHPTGTLLATAGMDNKIRIWNTSAITTDASERLYTTLTAHSGAVLSVRFSPTGRYLASGADDMVVLIWEHDTELRTWQPIRRLVGHESDVCDLAWSSRFLASCGLDNNIFIWDAQTFDIVKRIRGHEQFVKGVTFDPAERFLASQSDDKSLKIWRTSDWQLHRTITKPFEDNIFSTYFCRPSWAPDGDCIALANAANGRVPVAAVVTREWSVDLSLVGHHAAIEAVRFNPRVFSNSSAEDPPLCVCAAGGQDRSVTVWLTNQSVPLVAATELFSGSLLDLAWHTLSVPEKEPDGPSVVARLAACSFDGTVAVLEFTEDELGLPIDMGEQEEMLVKHGWTKASNNNKRGAVDEPGDSKRPRPIAESVVQLRMEAENKAGEAPAGGSVAETAPVGGSAAETTLVGSTVGVQSTIQHTADVKMPVPVRTKSGKKRVAPLFVRPLGVAPSMAAAQPAQLKEREQQEQQEQQGRHGDHEQLDQGSTAVPR